MKGIILAVTILILTGCNNDDLTWISIKNGTGTPIYALPYSSDFTNGTGYSQVSTMNFTP